MIPCRYCGKEIATGKEMFSTLKIKLKSYDMYWFCNNDVCLKEYLDNGEKPKDAPQDKSALCKCGKCGKAYYTKEKEELFLCPYCNCMTKHKFLCEEGEK